ncbi:MAG: hypothetical protein ACRC4M_01015 [Mycoplasma sp.]
MLKVNTDYINKYNKKETLLINSKFKSKIISFLENEYNLFDVDPEYIIELNKIYTENRPITFDNYFENSIFQFNPYINNQLISYINDYDFSVKTGVMTYATHFYRDYKFNLNQTAYEHLIHCVWKEFLSDINEKKLINHIELICDKFNSIISLIDDSLTTLPNKVHITSIDKLLKQYPLIPKDKLIEYANNQNHLMLVFGVNGNNKKKLSFLEKKLSVYGDLTASLYSFNRVSNESLKLITIYVPPSKGQLEEYIKNNNLNIENFSYALSTLDNDSNIIGLEIHFNQLMMYVMGKYSIHEIVKSPCCLDVGTKFKKNFIL